MSSCFNESTVSHAGVTQVVIRTMLQEGAPSVPDLAFPGLSPHTLLHPTLMWPCVRALQRISLPVMEMHEIQVLSLGWGDPQEKEMLAHSSILAWRIPPTEGTGGLQPRVSQAWTQLGAIYFKEGLM